MPLKVEGLERFLAPFQRSIIEPVKLDSLNANSSLDLIPVEIGQPDLPLVEPKLADLFL